VRRVLTWRWWIAHLVLVVAVLVMLRLGQWQWDRAQSRTGGIQNYAYALQWPLFAVFAIVVYVKTLIEETRREPESSERGGTRPRGALPPSEAGVMRQPGVRVGVSAGPIDVDENDEEMREWNARFAALHAATSRTETRRGRR
jgi:DNA-binding transcriptional regulator of glucitol operon